MSSDLGWLYITNAFICLLHKEVGTKRILHLAIHRSHIFLNFVYSILFFHFQKNTLWYRRSTIHYPLVLAYWFFKSSLQCLPVVSYIEKHLRHLYQLFVTQLLRTYHNIFMTTARLMSQLPSVNILFLETFPLNRGRGCVLNNLTNSMNGHF